jgi:hypothetical protein
LSWVVFDLSRERLRTLDILDLRSFIAAAEQQHERFTAHHKANAVPRAKVEAEFAHTRPNPFHIAEMANAHPVYARSDPCPRGIVQVSEPFRKNICLMDLRDGTSVA